MTREELSDALNMLDGEMIEETDAVRRGKTKKKRKKSWWKWMSAAACLAVIVFAGARLLPTEKPVDRPELPSDPSELPMLHIAENAGDGMGFEGYMAHDVSELVNANPWRKEMEITALPVYKNPLTYDETYYVAENADFDKMREFLLEIADRMGLDTDRLTIRDDVPDRLSIEAEGLMLEVNQEMTAEISFEQSISLPEKYNSLSYEDMTAMAEYLKKEYKNLMDFDDPQVNISGGEYNIYQQQIYSIGFFDKGDNTAKRIVNYNFNQVEFCFDEGKLFLIRIYRPDLSEKVGNYPIITEKEARELLADGKYSTSVPYEMPGMEFVKKAELIYRTGAYEKYFMPYYRFYVELPEESGENGLKTYGTYYVPAVSGEYISNMPVWDGRVN